MVTFERLDGVTVAHLPARDFVTDDEALGIGQRIADDLKAHPCRRLILDLSGVRGASSRLLGKVVALRRQQIENDSELALRGVSALICEQMTVTHLDAILEVEG